MKAGVHIESGGKDKRVGKGLYGSSPDDFFKHGIDIDFEKLRYHPLTYNAKCEQYRNDEDRFSSDNEK